jgi:cytochrome c oxidase subunit 4
VSHVVARELYYKVFGALIVLTAVTVGAAYLDLGALNTPVALTIAVAKAVLVILFFMHVRYSPRLTQVVVCAGFFWLGILVVLTLSDYLSRPWLPIVSR